MSYPWRDYGAAGTTGAGAGKKDLFLSHIELNMELGAHFWDPAGARNSKSRHCVVSNSLSKSQRESFSLELDSSISEIILFYFYFNIRCYRHKTKI